MFQVLFNTFAPDSQDENLLRFEIFKYKEMFIINLLNIPKYAKFLDKGYLRKTEAGITYNGFYFKLNNPVILNNVDDIIIKLRQEVDSFNLTNGASLVEYTAPTKTNKIKRIKFNTFDENTVDNDIIRLELFQYDNTTFGKVLNTPKLLLETARVLRRDTSNPQFTVIVDGFSISSQILPDLYCSTLYLWGEGRPRNNSTILCTDVQIKRLVRAVDTCNIAIKSGNLDTSKSTVYLPDCYLQVT